MIGGAEPMQIQNRVKVRTHLLVKDRLGLPTVTRLFAIVPTLPLSSERIFTLLILCHFVRAVIEATQLMNEGKSTSRHTCASCRPYVRSLSWHNNLLSFLKRTRTHMSGEFYDVDTVSQSSPARATFRKRTWEY